MCSLQKQTQSTMYFCRKCDVGLCIANSFEKWHNACEVESLDTKNSIDCVWRVASYIVVQRGQKTFAV